MAKDGARTLAKFTIVPSEDAKGFVFHVEDDTGEILEVEASRDQIEVIADALDDVLSQDDASGLGDGDDDEDKN